MPARVRPPEGADHHPAGEHSQAHRSPEGAGDNAAACHTQCCHIPGGYRSPEGAGDNAAACHKQCCHIAGEYSQTRRSPEERLFQGVDELHGPDTRGHLGLIPAVRTSKGDVDDGCNGYPTSLQKAMLQERDRQIAEQQCHIEERNRQIEERDRQLEEMQAEIERMRAQFAALKDTRQLMLYCIVHICHLCFLEVASSIQSVLQFASLFHSNLPTHFKCLRKASTPGQLVPHRSNIQRIDPLGNIVTLSPDGSPELSVEIRASYEADRMLGNGEVIGKLQMSRDELLNHGDEPFDLTFPPIRGVHPSLTLKAAVVQTCDYHDGSLLDWRLLDSDYHSLVRKRPWFHPLRTLCQFNNEFTDTTYTNRRWVLYDLVST
ncbi:hypothetical protein EDB19DRAFT_1833521 [Suillus lakei]|nr:hypothetical protein EDB19DRAFT_1833521 [Suillus lakei]